jgi:pyridoxine 5'-phosphate synthase PdxJ
VQVSLFMDPVPAMIGAKTSVLTGWATESYASSPPPEAKDGLHLQQPALACQARWDWNINAGHDLNQDNLTISALSRVKGCLWPRCRRAGLAPQCICT